MSTTIKIHFADGRDRDAEIVISPEQAVLVREFLAQVQYGDIHRRIADYGDGNRLGSPSDIKTRACRDGLELIRSAFAQALCDK
jgi:hypothetical protein